jgi:hypothetical protein
MKKLRQSYSREGKSVRSGWYFSVPLPIRSKSNDFTTIASCVSRMGSQPKTG